MSLDRLKFVFDLDDTLYSERDYARSALAFAAAQIARSFAVDPGARMIELFDGGASDPIGLFWAEAGLPDSGRAQVISAMRAHVPTIALRDDASHLIGRLRGTGLGYAILSDGRSVTQRAKIAALGCLDADPISISEETGLAKTDERRFRAIEEQFSGWRFVYVGDNPAKDFLVPNRLGWGTVMLRDGGGNIHAQESVSDPEYLAKQTIESLRELEALIDGP